METYTSSDAKREFGEVLTKSQLLRSELIKGQNSPVADNWNAEEFLDRARKRVGDN